MPAGCGNANPTRIMARTVTGSEPKWTLRSTRDEEPALGPIRGEMTRALAERPAGVTRVRWKRRQNGSMEIVSEQVHRVLAYVEALNRHGVRPARQVVNEFARKPDLTPTKRVNQFASLSASILQSTMWGLTEKVEGETFCQYLARLSWIEDKAQVELSVIGRALLKALNSPTIDESAADVFEIVLGPNNPFAYVQALQALSIPKNALLVEPYFRLEQLMDIAEFDNIKRVLVGPGLKMKDLELLATGLAALPIERSLEIRVAEALHDRYLIPSEEGSVTMLGMSLGGIGKKVSTITTVGEVASIALRDAHESIWASSKVVQPKVSTKPAVATAEESDETTAKAPVKKGPAKRVVPVGRPAPAGKKGSTGGEVLPAAK